MQQQQGVTLSYACSQDWDDMRPTAHGRHCDQCQHEVYDFTDLSVDEIRALPHTLPLCGRFRAEQIDPSLRPLPLSPLHRIRQFIWATMAMFGLQVHAVRSQHVAMPPATEQHDGITSRSASNAQATPAPTTVKTSQATDTCITTTPRSAPPKRYYLTSRFPFIVRRPVRTLGRFRS